MHKREDKHWTLLWVPAPDRSVKFVRIRKSFVFSLIAFMILTPACVILMHLQNDQRLFHTLKNEIAALEGQLSRADAEHLQRITDKDEYIEALQLKILSLSKQADVVQARLKALNDLEHELLQMTSMHTETQIQISSFSVAAAADVPRTFAENIGMGELRLNDDQSDDAKVQVKADVDDDQHVREEVLSHLGGEASTPTAQQWLVFSEEAQATLQALQSNILQLTARFTAMRDEILEMQRRLRYTPSIAPVNSSAVSSDYGIRSDPFTRRPAFHNGIDFPGKIGDPIYAAADGTVLSTGEDQQKGKYILLQHDYGYSTMYMHLSAIEVTKGDQISKGDRIGKMGTTGRSTGPHLHYEVWKDGQAVNPKPYVG